jgi:hypothetical protein
MTTCDEFERALCRRRNKRRLAAVVSLVAVAVTVVGIGIRFRHNLLLIRAIIGIEGAAHGCLLGSLSCFALPPLLVRLLHERIETSKRAEFLLSGDISIRAGNAA